MQHAWYSAAINLCVRIQLHIFLTTVAKVTLAHIKHAFSQVSRISKKGFANQKDRLACALSCIAIIYQNMLSSCGVTRF